MKRTVLTLCVALALSSNLLAQYSFSTFTRVYQPLNQSISVTNGITWDDPEFMIPIGFNFYIFNTLTDSVFGIGGLGGDLFSKNLFETDVFDVIIPLGPDLIDRQYFALGGDASGGTSNISYQLSGNLGSRVLTIEWDNAGFYGEFSGNNSADDFINYQVLLYEADHSIEISFGPSSINTPGLAYEGETGPAIMLIGGFDAQSGSFESGFDLSGSTTSPTFLPLVDVYNNYLDGTVGENTVYRFERTNLAIAENELLESVIYPNPAKSQVQISTAKILNQIKLVDVNGRVIQEIYPNDKEVRLNLSDVNPGVYLIYLESKDGSNITQKIIVE